MRKKSIAAQRDPSVEWSVKIRDLRERLHLNQTFFGQKLQSSAMAVSRWERGAQEPPSNLYIELGNLAGDPDCWYFWERAGLRSQDLMKVMPGMQRRLQESRTHEFEIVRAGSGKKRLKYTEQLVVVPLLKIVAAAHGEKGDNVTSLSTASVESVIAAPSDWCPNPSSTSCLMVRGDSMAPVICDGYIVAVDSSQTNRNDLDRKIVIVWNKDAGLTVSRYARYDQAEVLQPENSQYESVTLGKTSGKWKIVAKVLWWIAKAP
jgi:SOS-response transcriptional repressor LexA